VLDRLSLIEDARDAHRVPNVAAILMLQTRTQLKDRSRFETRYDITSSTASAEALAIAIRGHWLIENQLHWTLDVKVAI
jgi:predicted transposase YbfD/YdcC